MKKQTRKEKLVQLVKDNLTYYRLQADVRAVECDICENQPRAVGQNSNFFERTINEVQNELRRTFVRDMTTEKKAAKDALALFERTHNQKQLKLVQNVEKFKKMLDKKLFKKDKYGLERMQFAIAYMLENDVEYQRAEDSLAAVSELLFDDAQFMSLLYSSLRENFVRIHNVQSQDSLKMQLLGLSVASLFPYAPVFTSGLNVFYFVNAERRKWRMKQAFRTLSGGEKNMLFATKLTLIEMSKSTMPKSAWNLLVDEYLRTVNNFRADAEYEWLVEQLQVPVCKEKIAVCDLCVDRLSQIIGA